MRLAFLASSVIGVMLLFSKREAEKVGFTASVIVCPNLPPDTTSTDARANCTCIDIMREYDQSVSSVVARSANAVSRLLYNVL